MERNTLYTEKDCSATGSHCNIQGKGCRNRSGQSGKAPVFLPLRERSQCQPRRRCCLFGVAPYWRVCPEKPQRGHWDLKPELLPDSAKLAAFPNPTGGGAGFEEP